MASLLAELVQCRLMFLLALVLGIGSIFQYGYNVSSLASPSKFMKSFINDTWQHRYNTTVGEETLTVVWSSIVSVFSLGGLLGSVLSGILVRKFGKRRCVVYNSLFTIGASLIMGFSKMAGSFEMILIGRFFYGINTGIGMNLGFQFFGELAPVKFRGLVNTTSPAFVTVGKIIGQIFGLSETLGREDLWPLLLTFNGMTALLLLVVFPFFPDTPPSLFFIKKDKEGCIKAMKMFWGAGDYQAEIEELIKEQNIRKHTKYLTVLQLFRDKSLRPQLSMLIFLTIALQLCGISAIYFYANDVFLQAGFTIDQIPYISLGMGSCELLGNIICSILIDKFGRRTLLLSGYGVMGTALGLLTVTLSFQDSYSWVPYCSTVLIFIYLLMFSLGPSGVSSALTVDVLSHSVRASAFVVSTSLYWIGLYLIGMVFPYIVQSLRHFCFLVFLGCILITWILIFLLLPETKRKSLVEVQEAFQKIRCRQICCQAAVQEKQPEDIYCTRL